MANRYANREIDLMKGTIEDLKASIKRLEEQQVKITEEIEDRKERLAAWDQKLSQTLMGIFRDHLPKKRRPKGENFRVIHSYLEANNEKGHTVKELSEALRIPWSSVHKILQASPQIFTERKGLWFLNLNETNGNGDGKELQT